MELSSVEPPRDSVSAKAVDSLASTSCYPAHDKRELSDVAFGSPVEERPSQTSAEQPESGSEQLSSSEDSSSRGDSLACLSFLKKLWDIVESHLFESIWWDNNRKCVVIHEELFKEEVLARRGRLTIFESKTIEGFAHQLYEYGFTSGPQDFSKLGSRDDSLAEAAARKELHFYCNQNFQRFPHLLMKYKKRFVPKEQSQAGFSLGMYLHAHSRKRKADTELALETDLKEESGPFTAAPRDNVSTSVPRTTAPAKKRAKQRQPPESDMPLHLHTPLV